MDQNSADRELEAKLHDAVRLAQNGGQPHFVGFLDERQADDAANLMNRLLFRNYMLWGGYDGSERVVFGAFPDFLVPEASAFPVRALTAVFRRCDHLTHRDFLGALLSQGIRRGTLGDLLVEEGRCVLFMRSEIAGFVLSQVEKVGRVGISLSVDAAQPLPQGRRFEPFSSVVAAARLDCVVAAAVGTSREKAVQLIRAGRVTLDHRVNDSVSAPVAQGSKLSVRGTGRFILDRLGPVTKKGRLSIAGRKYI